MARRARMAEHGRRYELVQQIIQDVPTEDLPDLWVGLSIDVALHAVRGELPEVCSAADVERLVNAADKLHKMGRLAGGQTTANTMTGHVDLDALADKVQRLRDAEAGA